MQSYYFVALSLPIEGQNVTGVYNHVIWLFNFLSATIVCVVWSFGWEYSPEGLLLVTLTDVSTNLSGSHHQSHVNCVLSVYGICLWSVEPWCYLNIIAQGTEQRKRRTKWIKSCMNEKTNSFLALNAMFGTNSWNLHWRRPREPGHFSKWSKRTQRTRWRSRCRCNTTSACGKIACLTQFCFPSKRSKKQPSDWFFWSRNINI